MGSETRFPVLGPETRLTVLGAAGRLGTRVMALARETPGIIIAQAREHPGSAKIGQSVPDHPGLTYTSDQAVLAPCNVVVDISAAGSVAMHARMCTEAGVALLVAVTGLEKDAQRALQDAARSIPVCVAPNLATAVWVLAHLVKQASKVLEDFDLEVTETHHRLKKDAPSGTALMLARHAAEGRGKPLEELMVLDRTDHPGVRNAGSLGMVSIRGGDVIGDHSVHLMGDGERLELTHKATNRDVFARGALRLADRLARVGSGMHTVPALLGLA